MEIHGGSWEIRRYVNNEIILKLKNGASQYSLVLDFYHTPGLEKMVKFLFEHQVRGNAVNSEYLAFGAEMREEVDNGDTDTLIDCWPYIGQYNGGERP